MGGPAQFIDRFNFEAAVREHESNEGFPVSHAINITDFRLGTLLHLAAAGAGIVGLGTIETGTVDIPAVIWDDTADGGDNIIYPWQIPMDYNEGADVCRLYLKVRKYDLTGSASDNGNLNMTCDAVKFGPGDAAPAAITQQSVLMPALTQLVTWDAFTTVMFDLSANNLRAGGRLDIDLAPNETVATNNQLELAAAYIEYHSSLSYHDLDKRYTNDY